MSELQDFNQRVIREFRANQGKVSGQLANMPVLLLTMTGARSGRTLTTPLVYTTDGDRLVVIASFAGAPKHPAWYHNLLAHPEATVEVGSERLRVKATVTAGEERQRLFDRQAAQMPMILIEAPSSAYHHGMLVVGKVLKKRRRPPALLHQATPLVLRHRPACPHHGRLSPESGRRGEAAPPYESPSRRLAHGHGAVSGR